MLTFDDGSMELLRGNMWNQTSIDDLTVSTNPHSYQPNNSGAERALWLESWAVRLQYAGVP